MRLTKSRQARPPASGCNSRRDQKIVHVRIVLGAILE
jgi:hypothetical protein